MPVRRLRSVEDTHALVDQPVDAHRLWRTIASLWELSARLCPPEFPPGVHRRRSMQELNRATEAWEREAVRRAAARGRSTEGRS